MAEEVMSSFQQQNNINSRKIYSPLDSKTVRILTLSRGDSEDEISCSLEVVSLHEKPSYEALSYTWGDTLSCTLITHNGYPYYVTQNLYTALQRLRSPTSDRKLWIDALCIHQSDLPERNQQVREMHTIYATAQKVLAWLRIEDGLSQRYTNLGLELILKVESLGFSAGAMALVAQQEWMDIAHMLVPLVAHNYWNRLWVVQEVVFAREVEVYVGSFPAPIALTSIHKFLRALESSASGKRGLEQVHRFASDFVDNVIVGRVGLDAYGRLITRSLFQIINLKECKDPRDKVFGLYSLLPNSLRCRINIDYSASVPDVYISATQALVERDGNASCIAWRSEVDEEIHLPSWVFNWSLDNNLVPFSSLYEQHGFNACGNNESFFKFSGRLLHLKGVRVGVISQVQNRVWDKDSQGLLSFTTFVQHCREFLHEISHICPIDQSVFTLTCLGGLPESGNDSTVPSILSNLKDALFENKSVVSDEHPQDWVLGNKLTLLRQRAAFLFKPEKMHKQYANKDEGSQFRCLGLGSTKIQAGDLVTVLLGFDAPVILRAVGEHYEFVCDSYVNVFMHGEAIDALNGNFDLLEDFILC